MTTETYAYVASSVFGAILGLVALFLVIGDALDRSNRAEPRRTVARGNIRLIALLMTGMVMALVLCVWVVFYQPIPITVARWLLVGFNVSVAAALASVLFARWEYERASKRRAPAAPAEDLYNYTERD